MLYTLLARRLTFQPSATPYLQRRRSVKLVEVTHERDAKDQFILEKEKWISRLQQTVQTGDTEARRGASW